MPPILNDYEQSAQQALSQLPQNIQALEASAKSLADLAAYCAQASINKPSQSVGESKKYAIDSLSAVAYQVNAASQSIIDLLTNQSDALEMLALRTVTLQARIQMCHDSAGLDVYSNLVVERKFERMNKARKLADHEIPPIEQKTPLTQGRCRVNFGLLDGVGIGGTRGGGSSSSGHSSSSNNNNNYDSSDNSPSQFPSSLQQEQVPGVRHNTISGRSVRQATARKTVIPNAKPALTPTAPEFFVPPTAPSVPSVPSIPSVPSVPSVPTMPPPPPMASPAPLAPTAPAPPTFAKPTAAPPPMKAPAFGNAPGNFSLPPPPPPSDLLNDLPPPPPPTMDDLPPPPPPNMDDLPPPPPPIDDDLPPPPPPAHPIICRARVLYEYVATKADELTVNVGDIIDVVVKNDDGWWQAISQDRREGLLPGNYTEEI